MALTSQGNVCYVIKTPYRDGTTHIILEPLDFIARLLSRPRTATTPRTELTLNLDTDLGQRCQPF